MPYIAVKKSYIGFDTDFAKKSDHIEGDFIVYEILTEISNEIADIIMEKLKSDVFYFKSLKEVPLNVKDKQSKALNELVIRLSDLLGDKEDAVLMIIKQ